MFWNNYEDTASRGQVIFEDFKLVSIKVEVGGHYLRVVNDGAHTVITL